MELFKSDYFKYERDNLYCEDVNLSNLIEEYGTPLYVYSKKFFTDRFIEFREAFKEINFKVYYATKSNFNLNIMKIFYDLGAGIDVNSAGEMYRAMEAHISPKEMLLTGVGKTEEEIRLGLENNVRIIKAESLEEIHIINDIATKLGKIAPVAIRVNPNVDAKTHPYISTGLSENKFGIAEEDAVEMFKEADSLKNINVTGIDMHIGSQITKTEPYVEAVTKMSELIGKLRKEDIKIEHFDIGGGMGVVYKDEKPFSIKELAEKLVPLFKKLDCEILFEPGRFLTANGGVLLTEVLYTKKNKDKNFIIVDAAMTDLLRPSIYGAYHHIQPLKINDKKDIVADIVGPVCESSDFLGKERKIQEAQRGDYLAVMSAGSYGMAMSSNFNGRRRPAEIIVSNDKYYEIRSRETYDHLLYDEKIVDELHKQ